MIVTILPTDVVGSLPTTEEWMLRYGIPAPFVHKLIVDTVRLKATAHLYEGRVEEPTTPGGEPTIVIIYDEDRVNGKVTKVPRQRPPYDFPIRDLPPGLEEALRRNVKSIKPPTRSTFHP